jgi:hypothetical protein
VLAVLFVFLRLIDGLATPPTQTAIYTPQVAVVGVTGRYRLSHGDAALLSDHLDDAQAGSVSIRARYLGSCAAAGWTTLGAGRRVGVAGLCDPTVGNGRVTDWAAREAAARANYGDAQLGTLAASVPGCVAAVGPGAALAAARPDGSLASYATLAEFQAGGVKLSCPITVIDAGEASDAVMAELATRPDVTVILTGIGPPAGSSDPGLQVIYRLGTTLPGWLTSSSTRRQGIVTLPDLTATLIDFGARSVPATVDGEPFLVDPAQLSVPRIERHQAAVTALSDVAVIGDLTLGVAGVLLLGLLVLGWRLGRLDVSELVLTFGTVCTATMMIAGSVPWAWFSHPRLALGLTLAAWAVILTSVAVLVGRMARVPTAIAGAGLTVAVFTIDAALGGVMQPGSLLNSRPIIGGRWYGFGNVTFAAYAAATLLLAGYVAHRLRVRGKRRAALIWVAVLCFGMVVCEGWPGMGADFGGVLAMTPPLLWLLLVLSDVRVTWPKLLLAGLVAVLAVGLISVLDWLRGPGRRSHLGNFVQRILDGDASDVVARKAVASAESLISPLGLGALLIGIPLWVLVFRHALARVRPAYSTVRPVAVASLATAILGTLVNDGGISVWLVLTAAFAVTMAWFVVDGLRRQRSSPPARQGASARSR